MSEGQSRILLLVCAEHAQARLISSLAGREGWETLLLRAPDEMPPLPSEPRGGGVRAICIDLADRRESITGTLHELRARLGDAPGIALCDTREAAIEALREGATDYLLKPLGSERIVAALRAAERACEPRNGPVPLTEKDEAEGSFATMVATSSAMQDVLATAAIRAGERGPLLLAGEPGTGKDRLIRAIHAAGTRAHAPLRFVNAGLIAASAMESRLFGHEKNAFAGAFDRHVGTIQQCDGGTIVIDRIESLPMPLQQRLLDFLREGAVRPIGATFGQRVDVRLITTADVSMQALGAAERCLPELLAMLAPQAIELPALRNRADDIVPLAQALVSRFADRPGIGEIAVSADALSVLSRYDWPGNLRQLHATLLRAAVLCDEGVLTAAHLPALEPGGRDRPRPVTLLPATGAVPLYTSDGNLRPLEAIEFDVIRLAIGHYRGRMSEVARRLGIGRSTLYRKLSELGIDNAA